MNYISQLNSVFEKFYFDDRLNPSHLSLYLALFQEWNRCRFSNIFFIDRGELMKASKIGSKSTYHRCIRNLDEWEYLSYFPSNNPFKGSMVKMAIIRASDEQDSGRYNPMLEQLAEQYRPISGQPLDFKSPMSEQALVSNTNNKKHKTNNKKAKLPKNVNEVLIFFAKMKWSSLEAKKFYNHYNAIGWKIGGRTIITNWHSTAENWILKGQEINTHYKNAKTKKQKHNEDEDFLKINKEKNYSEPL
ncbi:hypothetical protein [Maribacter polysaccharolyticus]|uniref:hypothetical protein n=1 Tax=Maribacter polysaccharolyticus TaxID=3020831 RepID=UPI00237F0BAD|nr:hypothetical protein [Maribacter polysaccharolyticus]MDE3744091.1 hypothetical protein [Maribacter polysaccharolyticus]